ncbi:hypothetical protein RQP46_008282 [Phenoliferia psychrophenolica]
MGATMGGMVGLTIGFLFGSFAILRNGAGPRGFLPSLSGYMLTSAATFAFFMSIGTVIRTDGLTMREWAEEQVKQGRGTFLVAPSPAIGGIGGSPVLREWERRRKAAGQQ